MNEPKYDKALLDWVKGSWASDDHSNPITLYHRSNPGTLDREESIQATQFTPDPLYVDFESLGAVDGGSAIYPVYLSVKNPYVVIANPGEPAWESFVSKGISLRELRKKRFDGAVLVERKTGTLDRIQACEPGQIRPASDTPGFAPMDLNGFSKSDPVSDTTRFMFAGEASKTALSESLARAKSLADLPASDYRIWKETGWHQGTDRRWRYEISDHQARLMIGVPDDLVDSAQRDFLSRGEWKETDNGVEALFEHDSGLMVRASGATKEEAGNKLIDELARQRFAGIESVSEVTGQTHRLADVLDHPALFSAYPSLKDMPLTFDGSMEDNLWGYYEPGLGIRVNAGLGIGSIKSILLHEIQHAVQDIEGFAFGGMPEQRFADRVKGLLSQLSAYRRRELEGWIVDNRQALDAEVSASDMLTYTLMFQSWQRLVEHAHREKPSGVLRLIRNEMGWVHSDQARNSDQAQAFDDLRREWANLPKRHRMGERNSFLQNISMDMANLLREIIPRPVFESLSKDTRQTRSILRSAERLFHNAIEATRPLQELKTLQQKAEALESKHQFSGPTTIYRSLVGEIEARNTEARSLMTDEDRATTHPQTTADVPESDAIVVFKDDWSRGREFPMRAQGVIAEAFVRPRHPERTGLSRNTAQAVADSLMTGWKNRPNIIAVDQIHQLPAQVQKTVFDQRAAHDLRGVFHNNSVYLMASRLPSREALEEVVLHEVIGHYGLRGMLQDRLGTTLERVYFDTKNSPLSEEIKDLYFQTEPFNEDLADHRQVLAEEIMARMAESAEHRKLTETQRYIASVRQGLRDMGFQLPLTESDLSNLLHGAEQAVKNGGLVQPNPFDTCFRRAYHGSPHHFERFTLDSVGSGEGSTAFGWGLYFASEREVADFYRQQLTDGRTTYQGKRLTNTVDDPKQKVVAAIAGVMRDRGLDAVSAQAYEVSDLATRIQGLRQTRDEVLAEKHSDAMSNEEVAKALEIIDSEIDLFLQQLEITESVDALAIGNEHGALYEATIPDDDNLLDVDKPFDQQSATVQAAIKSALVERRAALNEAGVPLVLSTNPNGQTIYEMLARDIGEKQASLLLNKHGTPGLRYLDQYSRTASKNPTYNFVIWDASVVSVESVLADEAEAVTARLAQQKADNFSNWFHGSEVVDDIGNPLVLYHGTNESFDAFDAARARESETQNDALTFLSDRPDIASAFAMYRSTWEGANVMPVYANAKSLLVVDGGHQLIRDVENTARMPGQKDDETLRDFARRNGHDGIRFKNVREDIGPELVPTGDVYALFPEVSIKSATGNSGTYALDNRDIRFDRQTARSTDPTQSEAFMKWFDGSRVTTDDGKPMMVYHGTDHPGFTVFQTHDKSLDITPNALGENIGAFFAGNANHARDFGKNVSAYFLNLKRPAVFKTQQAFRDFMRQHSGRTPDARDAEGYIVHEGQFENRMRQTLESAGYDGVIIQRPEYNKTAKADKPWFIAFHPEQIKSASSNNGAFCSTNPDVRFSRQKRPETPTMQTRRGFHGSCHEFDQFSLDAFGNGEGAAAYGYGLYFTGKRAVAEFYRDILNDARYASSETCGWKTHGRSAIAKELLQHLAMEQAIDYAKEREGRFRGMYDGIADELREIRADGKAEPTGYLYEASIPGDEDLLDWDKTLAEQPASIRAAIRRSGILELMGNETYDIAAPLIDGGEFYNQVSLFFGNHITLIEDPDTGRHRKPASTEGDAPRREAEALSAQLLHHRGKVRYEGASVYLNMLGIPGLRYLDQLSRDKADNPSHNYVIWDDSLITIEKINDQAVQTNILRPATANQDGQSIDLGNDNDIEDDEGWQIAL